MLYKHGSSYAAFECHVVDVSNIPEFNSGGLLVRSTRRHVIEGKVYGNSQANLKTAILAFETAMDSTVTESGLVHSDGSTESAHWIDTAGQDTEKGIVVSYRWTSPQDTAQYVNYRTFQASIECTFLGPGAEEYEYSNRIIRIGAGGPVKQARMTLGGVVMQQVFPASPFRGIETGRKVSRIALPTIPGPTYPAIEQTSERQRETGNEYGQDGIMRYFSSWTYSYLSNAAF